MKLLDVVILALAVVFLIIGIDQSITLGFASAYWALMLALILFFLYTFRKRKKA
jgi:amino acid permease